MSAKGNKVTVHSFEDLQKRAPDLADLVTEGRLTLSEAAAGLRERQRAAKAANTPRSEWSKLLQLLPELRRLPAGELAEKKREHQEFIKRRDAFNALSQAEQVEMARFVLAHDPELANEVLQGWTPLFEAFHELKQAEALLEGVDG